MILNELEPIPETSLPLEPFKAHLRLGTGFGTETLQDSVLHGFLQAAVAAIEARVSTALYRRDFEAVFAEWRADDSQVLPIAPVVEIYAVELEDHGGTTQTADPARYRFEPDFPAPRMRATGVALPRIPKDGLARGSCKAGLADDWSGLPGELAQAVLLLAGHYYENRSDTRLDSGCTPFGVTSLLQRYRPGRLSVGTGR